MEDQWIYETNGINVQLLAHKKWRRQNILTEYDVNKCMDRQTLSSTQMLRVIFSSKSAENKERSVNSAS